MPATSTATCGSAPEITSRPNSSSVAPATATKVSGLKWMPTSEKTSSCG
jgi:hypothetical protein